MTCPKPALSVILLAPYGLDKLQNILTCLRAQTAAMKLQVVVVARFEAQLTEVDGFQSFKLLIRPGFKGAGPAKAQAVREADSDVVVFAEDHCFPESGWAAALIEAHKEGHAAVSPWMGSANPQFPWSTASFFNFLSSNSDRRSLKTSLPTHNSSYKRRLLLEFGDELDDLLEMETAALVPDLLARGWTVLHEPAARVWHVNVEDLVTLAKEQFYGGRHYGAIRAKNWAGLRKIVYAGGSVLIPILRVRRQGCDLVEKVPIRMWPAVLAGFSLNAFGEAWGYLFGEGEVSLARLDLECWRERHTQLPFSALEIVPTFHENCG